MKSYFCTLCLLMAVPMAWAGPICWYEPADAAQTDEITVWYDATQGTAGLNNYAGDVYVHAGVITNASTSTSDWKHAPQWLDNSAKYLMQRSADNPNLYSLTMTPATYFELDDGETISSLAFVFRNENGAVVGKDNGDADIIVRFGAQEQMHSELGRVISVSNDGTNVVFVSEKGRLIITPYKDYTFKVTTRPDGVSADERPSITVCATPSVGYTVTETDDSCIIATAEMQAVVQKQFSTISFVKGDVAILTEAAGLVNAAVPRRCTFAGMGDRAFYGGGYNGRYVNLNNIKNIMNNTQTGGWDNTWNAPHNICIPFYVSTNGYGVLFDDHYRGASFTPSSQGTTYETYSPTPIAYYFVGGDGSLASVLENYTFLTGRQELPPYWALGYLTSRYGYHSADEAADVIAKIKAVGLPLDALVFDLYWQGAAPDGMGNLNWYAPNFPEPTKMLADFAAQDVKTICITEPFFTSKTANYESLRQAGFFADNSVSNMGWLGADKVGLIDATNPEAMDWMWQFYKARTAEGVAGWWLDLGEPEQHDGDSQHQGGTVEQVHNEFGNLWLERVYRGLKEDFPNQRRFLMPRAGTSGMQRYSAFPWSGDIRRSWQGLQAQIPTLLCAGMSGVAYMGSDVGGFAATGTDAELYLRWVQFAAFSPMLRTHSPLLPEPYNECYANVLPQVSRYIHMRYRYLPYNYTLAYENATAGTPLARPVNFYGDATGLLDNCIDEYLWGKDLLVAPVMTTDAARNITFPDGEWVDMNNPKNSYSAGTTVSYSAPLEVLPLFARKGSFITTLTQTEMTSTADADMSQLSVIYFPSGNDEAAALIFDDDHTSTTSPADGKYSLTTLRGYATSTQEIIEYATAGDGYPDMPQTRTFTFVIPCYKSAVTSVDVDNMLLDRYTTSADLEHAATGYFCDADNTLYIKVRLDDTEARIAVNTELTSLSPQVLDYQLVLDYEAHAQLLCYTLPVACRTASVTICDLSGRTVAVVDVTPEAGVHTQPCTLPAGVFVGRLNAVTTDGASISCVAKFVVR